MLGQGHYSHAVMLLEQALAFEEDKGSILEPLGFALFRLHRFQEAGERFRRAIEVEPDNDYAHYCLGLSLIKQGKHKEAAKHFRIAWSLNPVDTYRSTASAQAISRLEDSEGEGRGVQ